MLTVVGIYKTTQGEVDAVFCNNLNPADGGGRYEFLYDDDPFGLYVATGDFHEDLFQLDGAEDVATFTDEHGVGIKRLFEEITSGGCVLFVKGLDKELILLKIDSMEVFKGIKLNTKTGEQVEVSYSMYSSLAEDVSDPEEIEEFYEQKD